MDFSNLVGPALATLGPWGLLIMVVATVLTALISGRLVSRASVERAESRYRLEVERIAAGTAAETARLTSMWEARLTESHQRERDWRAAFERSEQRADLLASSQEKLLMYAQTTEQFLAALPRGNRTR